MAWVPVFSRPAFALARWWTMVGSPIAPAATRRRTSFGAGANRPWWPMASFVPARSQAAIMSSASPTAAAIGFSPRTPFTPASAAAIVTSARTPCQVGTLRMSICSLASSSR